MNDLAIVTRHMVNSRKSLMKTLKKSLKKQTNLNFDHYILEDEVDGGKKRANNTLASFITKCKNRYIYILDDDDVLTDPKFVEGVYSAIMLHKPDVIICKFNLTGTIVPDSTAWGNRYTLARSAMPLHRSCLIVRTTVLKKYVKKLKNKTRDSEMISDLVRPASGYKYVWWNVVAGKTLPISGNGKPESFLLKRR